MFRAMRNAEILEQIQKSDPLACAFLDGLDARARRIEQNGGVFKAEEEVAEYLGITSQAEPCRAWNMYCWSLPATMMGGRRPLDLLREGEIQEVLDAAREFGQHGAA